MRSRKIIEKAYMRNATGEFCNEGRKLVLEVLLDVRDLLEKSRRPRKPSEWNKFVAKEKKKNPDIPFSEIAKKFRETKK